MIEEYLEAIRELNRAKANFNNAEQNFFEAANAELTAAQLRLNSLVKEMKKMKCSDCPYQWKEKDEDYNCCHWQARAPGDIPPCEEE